MQLNKYLYDNNITIKEFSLLTGLSRDTIASVISKNRKPTAKVIYKILEATKGIVTKAEMLDMTSIY